MTRTLAVLLLLAGCGGKGIQGTWRNTSMVTLTGGGTTTRSEDYVFLEGPDAWKVGGGCEAPLTRNADVWNLTMLDWTCPLNSSSGLPFQDLTNYPWKQGDVLLLKTARFEIITGDKLSMDFSLQYRTDPNDPTLGDTVEFHSKPGEGAERVK